MQYDSPSAHRHKVLASDSGEGDSEEPDSAGIAGGEPEEMKEDEIKDTLPDSDDIYEDSTNDESINPDEGINDDDGNAAVQ